jgi:hypothetical protein
MTRPLVVFALIPLACRQPSRDAEGDRPAVPPPSAESPRDPPAAPSERVRSAASPSASAGLDEEPPKPAACAHPAEAPAADQPTQAELATLHACDAEALYYGIGVPKDAVKARKCAFAQIVAREEPVFGGAAILMMVYANGASVPRNFDLGVAFACRVGGAPAELTGRLDHIERLRDDPRGREELDLCDDVTSGYMSGHCAAHRERFREVRRSERKRKAAVALPAPELATLERAAHDFFGAREGNEVDLSGTLRAAQQIDERAKLEESYVRDLERVPVFGFPPPADAAGTEAELNAVYLKLMSCPRYSAKEPAPGAISSSGIRQTERLWLQYRDAWIALGTKARPGSPGDSWKAYVTRERVGQLKRLASECP